MGRAVAALAADPDILDKSGGLYSSWDLALEYGFTDMDGSQPDLRQVVNFEEHYCNSAKTRVRWALSEWPANQRTAGGRA